MYQASSEVATLVVNTNIHGVHRDAQQHVAHGKIAQDERESQRIKRSLPLARRAPAAQATPDSRSKREQQAYHGECCGTEQQNTPRAEQAAKVHRERAQ
jgi:hypothetical protein